MENVHFGEVMDRDGSEGGSDMRWLEEQILSNPHIQELMKNDYNDTLADESSDIKAIFDDTKNKFTNLEEKVLEDSIVSNLKYRESQDQLKNAMKAILQDAKTKIENGASFGELYSNGNGAPLTMAIQYTIAKQAGNEGLSIDGLYGQRTKEAVRGFQKDNGLSQDAGWAGKEVIGKLLGEDIIVNEESGDVDEGDKIVEILDRVPEELKKVQKEYDDLGDRLPRVIGSGEFSGNREFIETFSEFAALINHTKFDFNGISIKGVSKEANKNRRAFLGEIKRACYLAHCFPPTTDEDLADFISCMGGKEQIESFEAGDKIPVGKTNTFVSGRKSYNYVLDGELMSEYDDSLYKKYKEKESEIIFLKRKRVVLGDLKLYVENGNFSEDFLIKEYFPGAINLLPKSVKKLSIESNSGDSLNDYDLNNLPEQINSLNLQNCNMITKIDKLPKNIKSLSLNGCENLETIENIPQSVTSLKVNGCDNISKKYAEKIRDRYPSCGL